MDQSVVDADKAIHNQLYGEEHFPFSRRAIIEQIRTDFDRLINFIRHPASISPIVFLFLLLILPITLIASQSLVNYSPRAQTASGVKIAFSPSSVNLPPDSPVKIMIDSQAQKIGFARVVFTFDISKVKLTSEITLSPRFSTVVEKTSMQTANSQGRAVLVVAASPTDILPSGSFELASFSIGSVSSSVGQTGINIDTNDIQIVDSAGNAQPIYAANLNINGHANSPVPTSTVSQNQSGPLQKSNQNNVAVKFTPISETVPPAKLINISLESGNNKIAFARVVFTFDKNKIKLKGDISTNPGFSTVVQKSSETEANNQGKAIIVIAASPTDAKIGGTIPFASFSVDASSQKGSSKIQLATSEIQIVDQNGQELIPSTTDITINSSGAPLINIPPPNTNPSQACQAPGSIMCFNQWFREFAGVENTKFADLSKDGKVTLLDYEYWRRAAYP